MEGERGYLPGNVGGTHGFTEFLEAVLDRTREEHRETIDWYGEAVKFSMFDETRARFGVENVVLLQRGQSLPKERALSPRR